MIPSFGESGSGELAFSTVIPLIVTHDVATPIP